MDWIEIKNVIPQTPRKVLLFGKYKGDACYWIGELGGKRNFIEFKEKFPNGFEVIIRATHWCEFTVPKGEECLC